MADKPAPFEWTDEKIEKAKDLIRRGYTAQQVAVQIDAPSRNVVIGKMHRLGLAGGGHPATSGKPRPVRKPFWTPERERTAIEMFDAGYSAQEIASAIGTISKSGVQHYLAKKGYKRDYTPAVRARIGKTTGSPFNPSNDQARKPPRVLHPSEADIALPESHRITLIDLRSGLCRWPLGDPLTADFCFCGADTDSPAKTYCPSHARLARGNGTPAERRAGEIVKAVA